MDVTDFQLKRPPGLNKILNTLNMKDNFDRDVYIEFLKRAKASTNNPKGLAIKIGYDNGVKPEFAIRTCSLCSIFFFYTKVQSTFQKVGKSAPYEEVENARVSLSFYELLLLCRDFRIIPKIITKEELYYLWKVMNVQKGKKGAKVSRLVSFTDFKDFLARIAILAFNKPGIRRMILSNRAAEGGSMPSPTELIGMLAKYMHLDDLDWVRNRVRTVGKATVSMINSRSAGEKNLLTKNNLREDLKGTRLAKILSIETDNDSQRVPSNMQRPASGTALPRKTGGVPTGRASSAPGRPKSRSKVATKLTAAQTQAQALEQKSTLSPFEDQVYAMLKNIEALENPEAECDEYDDAALHQFSVASVAQQSFDEATTATFQGVKSGNLNVSNAQKAALDQYHPSLAMVFDPYSDLGAYAKNKNVNFSNFDETEVASQNFLDMGCLVIGSKCMIRLHVVNDTPYEINVTTAIDGKLSNDDVKVTTLPNSFCPGLSHNMFISFTVCETVKNMSSNVANIITHCTSPTQDGFQLTNCCPVFFRAVRPNVSITTNSRAVQFPLCNESLLDELLDKFDLKNTLLEESNALRYNPSSNSFVFTQRQDFTHSSQFGQRKKTAAHTRSAPATSSLVDINPGAVSSIVRGDVTAPLDSPVIISRNPSSANLYKA